MKKQIYIISLLLILLFCPISSRASSYISGVYSQRGWQGGQSSATVSYYNLGNWHNYSEINNITISEGQAFADVIGTDTYLISSPIDFENLEVKMGWDVSGGDALFFRNADSVSGLGASPWFVATKDNVTTKRYVQYKLVLDGDYGLSSGVDIALSSIYYEGDIKGSNGETIKDWQICWEDYRCSVLNPMIPPTSYELPLPYFRGQGFSRTITASAPGYSPVTATLTANNYLSGTAGHYFYYYGVHNFVLNKVSTSSIGGATPSTTQIKNAAKTVENFGGVGSPAVPVLQTLQIGNKSYEATSIEGSQFSLAEKKIFSGTTIPNGVVHLYFHSDPFEDTVTADATGNWIYELTKDIGVGDHELQIAVTDPATNLTSEKSAVQKFTLVAADTDEKVETVENKNYLWWYVACGLLILAVLSLAGYLYLKKRNKKNSNDKIPT